MVVEKASDGVSGRAPGFSRSGDDDGSGLQYVSRKSDPSFRFFPLRGIYRQKGSIKRWASWPHHLVARPGAGPHHPMVWLAPGPPLSHLRSSRSFGKNRRFIICFVQFREYFLCSFSKHKNNRKQGTGTVASR
jgi:hypothetical protein